MELGVNIDHVATLRQARGTTYPDPIRAALLAEQYGADAITLHLREDRRHIQDRDVEQLRPLLKTRMNLEAAVTDEMIAFALRIRPQDACLVPERRQEVTTEGGLEVAGAFDKVSGATRKLAAAGIRVSLFIDADRTQIAAAREAGAPCIELHTGRYAEAHTPEEVAAELERIRDASAFAASLGFEKVNAGHGLHFGNVHPIAAIPQLAELNIGHALVGEAVFIGWKEAIVRMKRLMQEARGR